VRATLVHWIRHRGIRSSVAEDLAHDCIRDLLERRVELKTTPHAYLRQMALNKAVDAIRKEYVRRKKDREEDREQRRKNVALDENLIGPEPEPSPDPRQVQMLRFLVIQFFRSVDLDKRESKTPPCHEIMERIIGGQTQVDIALNFDCSREAVAKAWERCKRAARDHFRSNRRFEPYLEWLDDA
jgi:DNA-directed RNA polymerase specialized sigma24 family protein